GRRTSTSECIRLLARREPQPCRANGNLAASLVKGVIAASTPAAMARGEARRERERLGVIGDARAEGLASRRVAELGGALFDARAGAVEHRARFVEASFGEQRRGQHEADR